MTEDNSPAQSNDLPVTDPNAPDPAALEATQALIGRLSAQLEELTTKQKEIKDMLKGVFDNDDQLAQAEQQFKDAQTQAKDRKSDLNQTQEVKDLKLKLTDLTEDIKLVQESLNTHLVNYFQMTGAKVVDMPDGEEREIILKASLKRQRQP